MVMNIKSNIERPQKPSKMVIPEYVSQIHKYFGECFTKEDRCINCFDCIAFAILFCQKEELCFPIKKYEAEIFIKFIKSSITKIYLRCGRGISKDEADRYAKWILRLSNEEREWLRRTTLLAHAELQRPQ